jgi:hypothetical protein
MNDNGRSGTCWRATRKPLRKRARFSERPKRTPIPVDQLPLPVASCRGGLMAGLCRSPDACQPRLADDSRMESPAAGARTVWTTVVVTVGLRRPAHRVATIAARFANGGGRTVGVTVLNYGQPRRSLDGGEIASPNVSTRSKRAVAGRGFSGGWRAGRRIAG